MKWFSSDWHLGDTRITSTDNVFFRPFKTQEEQTNTILNNLKVIQPHDELFLVGDIIIDKDYLHILNKLPKCKRTLIVGNYDEVIINELSNYFDNVYRYSSVIINNELFYLNHYPLELKETLLNDSKAFGITGHVHGLWKIKRNMVNVSCDAWHFKPVSEKEILFIKNAALNYYDNNIFF
jgi:calcineurin-like phosphoesterase family protein